MKKSVIVFGSQGCGKSENAEALKAHFNLTNIIDPWSPDQALPPNTLALTNFDIGEIPPDVAGAHRFDDVMAEIRRTKESDLNRQ
ncbi:MAG: hypothetical protein CSB48_02845 [Proteobacteria bacterium]|nr:MAG: hypothetical protein CSB48_02845 [Pseudomonadota bacterium]